jgi:MFS family permease
MDQAGSPERLGGTPDAEAARISAAGTDDPAFAALAAFVMVALGGAGCIVAGLLADRIGRTWLTMDAMTVSGSAAIVTAIAPAAKRGDCPSSCSTWVRSSGSRPCSGYVGDRRL